MAAFRNAQFSGVSISAMDRLRFASIWTPEVEEEENDDDDDDDGGDEGEEDAPPAKTPRELQEEIAMSMEPQALELLSEEFPEATQRDLFAELCRMFPDAARIRLRKRRLMAACGAWQPSPLRGGGWTSS